MEDDLRPPTAPRGETPVAAPKGVNNADVRTWGIFSLLLLILLLVVWLLPSMVPDPLAGQQDQKPQAKQTLNAESNIPEAVPTNLRYDAEQALQNFLRLQAQPGLDSVEEWASEEWQNASNTAARGDDEFGQGDFVTALTSYKEAATQLQTILDNRDQILQKNLDAGWQYLDKDAVDEASAAFQRVLAMQADHQQAGLGLERSVVRVQVLGYVLTAKQAEISEKLQLAAETYGQALQLDPLYLPAREALQKVESELQNLAFQDALGLALQSIEGGKFVVAETALSEATAIRPGDVAISDARKRLASARRQARLTALRNAAEQFEDIENWVAANDRYVLALKIDPQAAFARNGLTRSAERLKLHQQLDHYLADLDRLYSDEPLDNARRLLTAYGVTATNEPLLTEKLVKLEQAVKLAIIPVELLIISDNLTDVTVYKVGRLGTFEEKELSLRPGKYTVTGSRRGYRDVLKTVELKPGAHRQSLDIRTEEQI